jgi:flagellar hook assembly protein FlgD
MSVPTAAHPRAASRLTSILAVVAAVVILALTSLPSHAAAAGTRKARLAAEPAPKRAVIVVGPVGSSTTKYKEKGNAIAAAAAAHGMEVTKIFTPAAVWSQVVAAANGADLFVYLGHGNGWPSPNPPFQEDTKDGLGLNPSIGTDNTTTKYYGANRLRESIKLAPNAIVILNKLCYAEGNAEPGMPIPTTDVARQRVDNFASGFLAIGAKAVFALGWQPGEDVVNSLFDATPKTMDDIFMTRFGSNRDGSYKPYFGWIGWKPNLYFDSVRTPGAVNHLDPDPQEGYLRAVTGDLEFTNTQWLGAVDSDDTEPPVLSDLSGAQAANTIPAGENAVPVFTPNGDGLSDTMTLRYTLSEGAFLKVQVKREDETVIRTFNAWSEAGRRSTVWDGRNNSGAIVKDGKFDIVVTPRDSAGNVGDSLTTTVKVLTAIKKPTASPILFDPTDGDLLAPSTTLGVTLLKEATIDWRIVNGAGDVVRHGMADAVLPIGPASWTWDGLDDAGQPVPVGAYRSVVTATTSAGRYSHATVIRLAPFNLKAKLTVSAGTSQKVTILAAEPVKGWPVITVKQPGLAAYKLYPTRYTTTKFTATWKAKAGATGPVTITITSTDNAGGTQQMVVKGKLQ